MPRPRLALLLLGLALALAGCGGGDDSSTSAAGPSLDTSYAARTRYSNRIDEQIQFNAADPAKVPQAVPGVGDKGAYNHNASWIPAYSTLWAVRGNRWLTVVYSAADKTRPQRLAAVAPLARQAFRLTAR